MSIYAHDLSTEVPGFLDPDLLRPLAMSTVHDERIECSDPAPARSRSFFFALPTWVILPKIRQKTRLYKLLLQTIWRCLRRHVGAGVDALLGELAA